MDYVELPMRMIRENSIKTDGLKEMIAGETIHLIFKYQDEKKSLIEMIKDVTNEIEIFVKAQYDVQPLVCKKLIELKRNIFNIRFEKIQKYESILNTCDGLEKTKLFVRNSKQLDQDLEHIKSVFDNEYRKSRSFLHNEWNNENTLLCGLFNYDSNLTQKVKKYIAIPADEHNTKNKKLDNTLYKIYTRAVLKPSPFSTFCGVKLQLDDVKSETKGCKKSRIQLNYVHILRIWEMIAKQDDVMKKLHYKVNLSIRKEDDGYTVSKLIDMREENGKVYEGKTILVHIPESELVNCLFEIRTNNKEYSYQDMLKILGIEEKEEVFAFLLEKKLIYSVERPKEISLDIINDFISMLELWKISEIESVKEVRGQLEKVDELCKIFENTEDWEKRTELYFKVQTIIGSIYHKFGCEKWCDNNVIYEDYINDTVEETDFDITENDKEIMKLLSDINLLFDVNVRTQTMFGSKFNEKYGDNMVHTSEGTIISQLIDANRNYNYLWENNMSCLSHEDDPQLVKELDDLKTKVIQYVKSEMQSNREEVLLDIDYLKNIVSQIPEGIRNRKKSYSYFLQRLGKSLIINNVYSGYLMYFSRFLQYFPSIRESESFNVYKNRLFNGDEKICDIRVASGFNGNMRPQITEYELRVPTQSELDSDQQIDYRDCYYHYDKNEKRVKLFHKEIGDFTVTSLGSLMPLYLPGITGLLHSMFVNSLAFKDLNKLDIERGEDIIHLPRIRIGNVVICRQSWRIKSQSILSVVNPVDDLFTTFCKLNIWLNENSISSTVFIRKDVQKDMADMFLGKTDGKNIDMTARKPQYIDFRNPLAVKLFIKMCFDGYDMVFEEALPDYSNQSCYVQEAIYEISYV